jgi:dUTP pyrophosphatase
MISEGVIVLNAPTIDTEFDDEVKVLLLNLGKSGRRFAHGERIATLVLNKIEQVQWTLDDLGAKKKSSGGRK